MMRGGASRAGKTDRMWRTQDRPRDWQVQKKGRFEQVNVGLQQGRSVEKSALKLKRGEREGPEISREEMEKRRKRENRFS
mmetsp:Transcript_16583/g.55306  ORF Transcript_16583/g.55306 Transcript_16583/m.55306 type:complete len:80 (-) Transcript_16583:95-334(-)